MKPKKDEMAALSALLEQGAETPEILAEEFIKELDRLRGERGLLYYAVTLTCGIYAVVGPFSTKGQAERAVTKAGIAERYQIMAGRTAEGLALHMEMVDKEPEPYKLSSAEQAKRDKGFWAKVNSIRENEVTAITGNVEVRAIKLPVS